MANVEISPAVNPALAGGTSRTWLPPLNRNTGLPFMALETSRGDRVGSGAAASLPLNDWSIQLVTAPEAFVVTPKSAANWSLRPFVTSGAEMLPVTVTTTWVEVWTPQLSV